MTIIEKLTARFKKQEKQVVTTRNLVHHMINDRVMLVPNYKESKEEIKSRKKINKQVSKNLEM